MKNYYLRVLVNYADMLSYERRTCFILVSYECPQNNMMLALHDVLSRFYSSYKSADIIDIKVLENKLYKVGEYL